MTIVIASGKNIGLANIEYDMINSKASNPEWQPDRDSLSTEFKIFS